MKYKFECLVPGCSAKYSMKGALRKHSFAQHAHLGQEELNRIVTEIRERPYPELVGEFQITGNN
jgi:hypothetical protein